ncbi:MAG: esterase, partial [Deltaproteobacteria bacterium]|nr:esterase [Deltaproteobacteria bacterium]
APTTVELRVPGGPSGETLVTALLPGGRAPGDRFPLVVAFPGRGEALKPPRAASRGWVDDYELARAAARVTSPPLTAADLHGLVTGARLATLNADLARAPYAGVVVACPSLPDSLRREALFTEGPELARFVAEDLLPRLRRELPVLGAPEATAVDGVSLGGRAALIVGLTRPEAFGVVAALQPAIDARELGRLASLAAAARGRLPGLTIRLVTSDGDYFLGVTRDLSSALRAAGVPSRLDVVTGPHSYEWNRGPGAYELLLFHDRALRGQPAP